MQPIALFARTALRSAAPRWTPVASVRCLSHKPKKEDTDKHAHANAHAHHKAADKATGAVGFIERVKSGGKQAMLGPFATTGLNFDRTMAGLTVTKIGDGAVTCEVPVSAGLTNAYGTLHGGATATLVDIVGTMALLTVNEAAPGVSVELSTSYLSAAKEGDTVVAEGKYVPCVFGVDGWVGVSNFVASALSRCCGAVAHADGLV